MFRLFCVFVVIFCVSCKKFDLVIAEFQNVAKVDIGIENNDTIKKLFQLKELKNYPSDTLVSAHRTSYSLQNTLFSNASKNFGRSYVSPKLAHFDNYKCEAKIVRDTLNITLNNFNGYYGNGIVIKVHKGKYLIKNINPNPRKGAPYFLEIDESKTYNELTLNKSGYVVGDSIMGNFFYQCIIPENFRKEMLGYFRTKVQ